MRHGIGSWHVRVGVGLLLGLAGCARAETPSDASAMDATNETSCVTGAADQPDSTNTDSNCDGVDGDRASAVFVATDGDDANPGTAESPMRTVRAALARAMSANKTQVLVAVGMYTETSTLRLVDGVGIYGGYDRAANWARGMGESVVSGASVAVEALGLTRSTVIARIEFDAADGTAPAGASIALRAVDAAMLRIEDHATISAGHGAAGANGQAGSAGADGMRGVAGLGGAPDDQTLPGEGGAGGTNASCPMANGGAGGRGGQDPGFLGQDGHASASGVPGGHGGGMPGCSGVMGEDGTSATGDGSRGDSGHGGAAAGRFDATTFAYLPAAGTDGLEGQSGSGGGGGGGSSGQTGAACIDGAGNGGGGGGAGGCGGTGGTAGGGGGASVAILAIRSPITITDSTVQTLGGGPGGAGGSGGSGGMGGGSGSGGTVATNELGRGGNGGAGKRGGEGGAGGGGGGGPSIGIWVDGMAVNATSVVYQLGDPGRGGISPGGTPSEGARGTQAQTGP